MLHQYTWRTPPRASMRASSLLAAPLLHRRRAAAVWYLDFFDQAISRGPAETERLVETDRLVAVKDPETGRLLLTKPSQTYVWK